MRSFAVAILFSFAIISVQSINLLQCITDVEKVVPVLQGLVNDVETRNLQNIIQDLTALIADAPAVIADCGLDALAIYGDVNDCILEAEQVVGYAEKIIQNPSNIIQDIQELEAIYQTLPALKQACSSLSSIVGPHGTGSGIEATEFLATEFFAEFGPHASN